MAVRSEISCIWKEKGVIADYRTGVSLHSHTSMSEESLSFIQDMSQGLPFVQKLFAHYTTKCHKNHALTLDFVSAHWRPPLQPLMAFDLEFTQIANLGLHPLVSISDHDNMEAPMLLRTVPHARNIPVSVEWTAPFGRTCFHLGIHNLPTADARMWMERFTVATASPDESVVYKILRDLHSLKQVLIVFNHPIWDLYSVGREVHMAEVRRFLAVNGDFMHALELNGLRHASENREVTAMARETGHLLISGGDRHGMEPNANINLTSATSFHEFVHEIRVERRSHVLFMAQYAQPWKLRILRSTLDAVTDYSDFMPGWQRWDERAFHKDRAGVMQPLSNLWVGGKAPKALALGVRVVRMARNTTVARSIGMAFPGKNDFRPNYDII
ncbi:hypothetical protein Terro_0312 [Terriglobus roseus DSM 18391]|uniref:Uncharacterized protein n=1 Tax=Terriglobus roseus (strain DSM 18391 / NRRL B-41598 / KBS 63) TaxID=926566 RepID=I3ZBP3_TERRK|nr:hypothetical protein [Terriglobus roseus]AFL86661.1 hypothetical protein Terro_0312 [Terriglobus roseus DSM 18391]